MCSLGWFSGHDEKTSQHNKWLQLNKGLLLKVPGLAYFAVDELVDVGISKYRDASRIFVTTLKWETWKQFLPMIKTDERGWQIYQKMKPQPFKLSPKPELKWWTMEWLRTSKEQRQFFTFVADFGELPRVRASLNIIANPKTRSSNVVHQSTLSG